MKLIYSNIVKILIVFNLISTQSYAQDTRPNSEFKSSSVFLNYSNSIFNTPIEQYKYVKTYRGIEVYETYRHPTNGYVNQTIFPKTMPLAIIKTNAVTKNTVIYRNYTNSIFNRPIEFGTIKTPQIQNQSIKNNQIKNLPKYNGEGEISYGE